MASTTPLPVVTAKLDLKQPLFNENRKSWEPVLERFQKALQDVTSEGDERSQRIHNERGQLLGQ
jgi:hypothetical protein